MVPEHEADPASLYREERTRFVATLRSLSPDQLATPVAATPLWTVHDVLAHVVAIAADLNAQRFDPDPDGWTLAQVTARRAHSVDQLADEWDHEGPTFEAGLRLFGYDFGAHFLGDLLQHACDVDAALGRPPARDDLALTVALDFYLGSLGESLEDLHLGALALTVGAESWVLGPGEVIASLSASRFEVFRALGGRRTRAEIAAFDWTGAPDHLIDVISRYPMPTSSLGEPRGPA